MSGEDSIRRRLEDAFALHQALLAHTSGIAEVAAALIRSYRAGGKALLFGNGGSAADAQHIAAELVGKYYLDRRPLPAIALTVNPSALTAIANDYSFSHVYARQIEAMAKAGDVVIGISTSGRSRNVLEGLGAAKRLGMVSILLTGQDGKPEPGVVDYCIAVPSTDTPRIQEAHILIGHILCELVEVALCGTLPVQTVFLDQNTVINRKGSYNKYARSWVELEFLPGTKEALAQLRAHAMHLIVLADHRGVSSSQADLREVHRGMLAELSRSAIRVDGIYYCPHDEEQCLCRRPQTGLYLQARVDFPEIEFSRAAVIGDSLADMEAGARLGAWTILIGDGDRQTAVVEQANQKRIVIDRTASSLLEATLRYLFPRPLAS